MQSGQGKPITLTVLRNGAELPPITVHPFEQDGQWRLGFMPAQPPDIAGSDSAHEVRHGDRHVKGLLRRQFADDRQGAGAASYAQGFGEAAFRPGGHRVAAGQAAEAKEWYPKFGLAASISLNLGILNLMPFPILDGGLILLLLIESVMRHDISMIVKERIYQAAFVVLVAFFAFIMFNDVSKLQIFSHFKP